MKHQIRQNTTDRFYINSLIYKWNVTQKNCLKKVKLYNFSLLKTSRHFEWQPMTNTWKVNSFISLLAVNAVTRCIFSSMHKNESELNCLSVYNFGTSWQESRIYEWCGYLPHMTRYQRKRYDVWEGEYQSECQFCI